MCCNNLVFLLWAETGRNRLQCLWVSGAFSKMASTVYIIFHACWSTSWHKSWSRTFWCLWTGWQEQSFYSTHTSALRGEVWKETEQMSSLAKLTNKCVELLQHYITKLRGTNCKCTPTQSFLGLAPHIEIGELYWHFTVLLRCLAVKVRGVKFPVVGCN